MAVSGPRVLEMATGERVDLEALGGWRLHAEVTGQIDRWADTEEECFALVREFLSFLPSHAEELPPVRVCDDADADARQETVGNLLPTDPRVT